LQKNKITQDALTYTGAIALARIPAFLFLPIFAAFLSPRQMGQYITAWLCIDLLQTLAGMGMIQSLGRFFPVAQTPLQRKEVLSTAIFTTLASSFGLAILAGIFYSVPSSRQLWQFLSSINSLQVTLILLAAMLTNITGLFLVYLRAEQKALAFFAVLMGTTVIEVAGTFYLIQFRCINLSGILSVECLRLFGLVCVLLYISKRDIAFIFSRSQWQIMFSYGIYLVPAGLFIWVLFSIDRFWLGQLAGLDQVGVYGFFYKFVMPVNLLFQGYIMSLDSQLFKLKIPEGEKLITKALRHYLFKAGILVITVSLMLPYCLKIGLHFYPKLPIEYFQNLSIFPLFMATAYVYYWGVHYASLLDLRLRSRRQFTIMGLSALLNFGLCFVMIQFGPSFGLSVLTSAAISNLISACFFTIMQWHYSGLGLKHLSISAS
jgi:O-antigen/teichoic acid export membrane protein